MKRILFLIYLLSSLLYCHAELEITFRWKNNADNLGIKTNIAEISEDYNDCGSKDIDSTTDNILKPYEKEQEDDDDFALVIFTFCIVPIKDLSQITLTNFIVSVYPHNLLLSFSLISVNKTFSFLP